MPYPDAASSTAQRRRSERVPSNVQVEYIIDTDVIPGTCVDMSETGCRLSSPGSLPIIIRAMVGDQPVDQKARLVWAQRKPDGHFEFGLEFLPS